MTINNTGSCTLYNISVSADVPGGWGSDSQNIDSLAKYVEKSVSLTLQPVGTDTGTFVVTVNVKAAELKYSGNVTVSISEVSGQENVTGNRTDAEKAIADAKEMIGKATEKNLNVSEAQKLLEEAEAHFNSGDYQNAEITANNAYALAEQILNQYVSSGIWDSVYKIIAIAIILVVAYLAFAYFKTRSDERRGWVGKKQ